VEQDQCRASCFGETYLRGDGFPGGDDSVISYLLSRHHFQSVIIYLSDPFYFIKKNCNVHVLYQLHTAQHSLLLHFSQTSLFTKQHFHPYIFHHTLHSSIIMPTNTSNTRSRAILSNFPPFFASKKKENIKKQTSRPTRDIPQSPLALSSSERAQLLKNNNIVGDREPKKKIGVVDYSSILPVPVPSTDVTATSRTIKEESVKWYQGYHSGYKRFYYYNDQTKESQWGRPMNESYIPYDFFPRARITSGRVVVQRSNAHAGSSANKRLAPLHVSHSSKCKQNPRPRTTTKNGRGCTRHATTQDKKTELVASLVEAMGCDSKDARAALLCSNGNSDKAAEMLLKATKPKTQKPVRKGRKPPSLPDELMCSICLDVMISPVVAADGHTYCKECIRAWLKKKNTSPKTNERLRHKTLTPNYALRSLIRSSV